MPDPNLNPNPNRVFEFWLGRAGSGKTHACVDAIAAELRASPRGPGLFFLVPEQASAQMEQALASQPGIAAFTRARVITFRWLEREIFKATGGAPRRALDDGARVMLLRQIIRRRRSGLSAFGQSADLPGIAEAASQSIVEFRRYGWSLADLEAEGASLRAESDEGRGGDPLLATKLADLALLWREYEIALRERALEDEAFLAGAAAARARQWPALEGASIWIDGFASFTAQEATLVEALTARASWAALALCLDPVDAAFRRTRFALGEPVPGEARTPPQQRAGRERVFENVERALLAFHAKLRESGWRVEERHFPEPGQPSRFSNSPALAHMEAGALTRLHPLRFGDAEWRAECESEPGWPRGPIELAAAASRREEVEAAARRIAALCGESATGRGYAWSDVALLVRDLAPYAPLVREIFPRFGIPFFIDEKRAVAAHPLARLLMSALEICSRGWRPALAVAYLKSGLAAIPDLDSAARIERLLRECRLDASDLFDEARWTSGPHDQREAARCAALHRLWLDAARPIHELRARLEASDGDPARALWDFLLGAEAPRRLECWIAQAREAGDQESAMMHQEAWKEAVALLDRLRAVGVGRLESGACDAQELLETVEAGLSAIRARLVPPTLEQVLVGSVERTRTPSIKAVFVLGMIEGEFPKVYDEDPMFGDRERERLARSGRELGPDSRRKFAQERFLAYIALTRASHYLFASYPAAGSAAGTSGPSSFFRALAEESFPMAFSPFAAREAPALLPGEWAARLASAYHAAVAGEDPAPLGAALAGPPPLSRAELADPANAAARASAHMALGALHPPRQPSLDPSLAREFLRAAGRISVTGLETYAQCPFRYFGSRMLRLEPLREPTPGVKELGSLRHKVLETLFLRLAGRRGFVRWGEIDLAEADRIIEEAAREEIDKPGGDLGRDAVTQSIVALAVDDLRTFARAMRAMGGRYGFVQSRAEMKFGFDPSSRLELSPAPGLSVPLNGVVDRVDRLDEDAGKSPRGPVLLALFDYKSSARSIDASRLLAGLDLQLPAYALALEKSWPDPRGARVVGAFYWPLRIGMDKGEGESDDWNEPGTEAWFSKRKIEGLFEAESAARLDSHGGPGASALAFKATWTAKGGLDKRASGWLPASALRALLDVSYGLMQRLAKGIADGQIDVAPFTLRSARACDTCELIDACRLNEFGPAAERPIERCKFDRVRALGAEAPSDGR